MLSKIKNFLSKFIFLSRFVLRRRKIAKISELDIPEAEEYRLFLKILSFFSELSKFLSDIREFSLILIHFIINKLHLSFIKFEKGKGVFVEFLYRQRGKYAKRFVHSGMAGLAFLGIVIAPIVAQEFPNQSVNPWEIPSPSSIVSASTEDPEVTTQVSEKLRDRIIEYSVQEGDTVSSIAKKFGVATSTILWQNNLNENSKLKPGQILEILPVDGVSHKVQKGDTIYSIAKKYDASSQAIVDFPYNTFVNDETFELAIGQIIIVPNGVKPSTLPTAPRIRQITPDAGTVVASGTFVWPTSGTISQGFYWYHKGIDIANKSAPNILAADSGTVVVAGWVDNYGYGNRVVIDHGNGYKTLYAHLSQIYVKQGQTVKRGDAIGKMGCTGRCTGTHLHFEIIKKGTYIPPLSILR